MLRTGILRSLWSVYCPWPTLVWRIENEEWERSWKKYPSIPFPLKQVTNANNTIQLYLLSYHQIVRFADLNSSFTRSILDRLTVLPQTDACNKTSRSPHVLTTEDGPRLTLYAAALNTSHVLTPNRGKSSVTRGSTVILIFPLHHAWRLTTVKPNDTGRNRGCVHPSITLDAPNHWILQWRNSIGNRCHLFTLLSDLRACNIIFIKHSAISCLWILQKPIKSSISLLEKWKSSH